MKSKFDKKESKKQLILDKLKEAIKRSEYTEIFVWGSNSKGQLGISQSSNESLNYIPDPKAWSFNIKISQIGKFLILLQIIYVAWGSNHTLLLERNGYLYSMGWNEFGQLGIQNDLDINITLPTLNVELKKFKITKVAWGDNHSAAIISDGRLFTWGYGKDGALGHGSQQNVSIPKLVEYFWIDQCIVLDISCGK